MNKLHNTTSKYHEIFGTTITRYLYCLDTTITREGKDRLFIKNNSDSYFPIYTEFIINTYSNFLW